MNADKDEDKDDEYKQESTEALKSDKNPIKKNEAE